MRTTWRTVTKKHMTKVPRKYKSWYSQKVPYKKKYTKKVAYKKRYNRKVCSAAKKVCTRRGTSRINIRVGSSRGHTKVITLSRNINSQYRVYAKPVNRQHRGWKDRFRVTRRGNRIWVRRLDRNHGWGQQLILQARKTTCTRYSAPKRRCTRKSRRITARRNIRIGNSGSNTKWITLPSGFTHVSNRPINRQHRGWRDRFVTTVRGNRVAVRRTDYRGGWGQNLVLQAYRYSTVCTRYSAPKKTCRNVPYTKTHYKT